MDDERQTDLSLFDFLQLNDFDFTVTTPQHPPWHTHKEKITGYPLQSLLFIFDGCIEFTGRLYCKHQHIVFPRCPLVMTSLVLSRENGPGISGVMSVKHYKLEINECAVLFSQEALHIFYIRYFIKADDSSSVTY